MYIFIYIFIFIYIYIYLLIYKVVYLLIYCYINLLFGYLYNSRVVDPLKLETNDSIASARRSADRRARRRELN